MNYKKVVKLIRKWHLLAFLNIFIGKFKALSTNFQMVLKLKLNFVSKAFLYLLLLNCLVIQVQAVNVGDPLGGGTVFCVSQTPDVTKCVPYGSGNYGLVVSNEDLANFDSNPKHGIAWASSADKVVGARSDDDGSVNTAAIIAVHSRDNPSNNAAWLCRSYRDKAEGHDDWYLPAKNELSKLYLYARDHQLIGKGCVGSVTGGIQCFIGGYEAKFSLYWSSTEYSKRLGMGHNCAWFQGMGGTQNHFDKVDGCFGVRAVRIFSVLPTKGNGNPPAQHPGAIAQQVMAGEHKANAYKAAAPTAVVSPPSAHLGFHRFMAGGSTAVRAVRVENLTKIYPPDYQPPTLDQAMIDADIRSSREVALHCDDVAACAIADGRVNCTRLTKEDVAAIAMYTFDFGGAAREHNPYRLINNALFERDILQLRKVRGLIYRLLHALRNLPVVQHQTLYRGIKDRVKMNDTHYHQGNKITWHTFVSTTTDLQTTQNFLTDHVSKKCEGTLFIIRGTTWGYNIQPFSCFPKEREILLEPEIEFRVTGVVNAPLLIVELEMLLEQKLLLENLIPRNVGNLTTAAPAVTPSAPAAAPEIPSSHRSYVAPVDWESNVEEGLSFRRGEVITIIDDSDHDWWLGEVDGSGSRGWIPAAYFRDRAA